MSEILTRPNGKTYRPQKAPEAHIYESYDDGTGVVVLYTHDAEEAARIAASELAEFDLKSADGIRSWWKLVPWDTGSGFDRNWITDEARGTACVVWEPRAW